MQGSRLRDSYRMFQEKCFCSLRIATEQMEKVNKNFASKLYLMFISQKGQEPPNLVLTAHGSDSYYCELKSLFFKLDVLVKILRSPTGSGQSTNESSFLDLSGPPDAAEDNKILVPLTYT